MSGYKLRFDGYSLKLIENGVETNSWNGISGRPGYQSPRHTSSSFVGPIPEGNWQFNTSNIQFITVWDDALGMVGGAIYGLSFGTVKRGGTWFGGQSAWGLERVFLEPAEGTNTFGRTSFSIHGGSDPGSAGCIDLGYNEVDFFRTLHNKNIGSIALEVKYDERLLTEPHPAVGNSKYWGPFSRGANPTDHLGRPIATGLISQCFLAGTKISIPDGKEINIEDIRPGMYVESYCSETLNIEPRIVTRIFTNTTDIVVNMRGMLCTPGHLFFTKDFESTDRYSYETISDILLCDGVLVLYNGALVRARTGALINSQEDKVVKIKYVDPKSSETLIFEARSGIFTAEIEYIRGDGSHFVSSMAYLMRENGIEIVDDKFFNSENSEVYEAIEWPFTESPLDIPVLQNWILRDYRGLSYTPVWIAQLINHKNKANTHHTCSKSLDDAIEIAYIESMAAYGSKLHAAKITDCTRKITSIKYEPEDVACSYRFLTQNISSLEPKIGCTSEGDFGKVVGLESENGWTTYNFEVEGFHTYIAGGYRVHNDSTPTLVVADAQFKNIFGYEFTGSFSDLDKMMGAISDGKITAYGDYVPLLSDDRYAATAYDWIRDKIIVSVDELDYQATTVRDGIRQQTRTYDPVTGNVKLVQAGALTAILGDGAAGNAGAIEYEAQKIKAIYTALGQKLDYVGATAALGTQIGNAIAGDNFAAKVATSALLSTFLGKFAASLGSDAGGTKTIAVVGENGVINFDQVITDTFSTLGSDISANIRGQLVGALSSFLVAELAETLGLKDGVTKGVFTTVVGGVTTTVGQQLVENIVAMMDPKTAATATLFKGFDTTKISGNIQNALGAYFGSELGKVIVTPKTPEAALFASAVASVMSTLLAGFPVIGPFIGSAIGQTVGAIVGRVVFDDDMLFLTPVQVNERTGALVVGPSVAKDASKNDVSLGYNLAAQITNDINKFIVDNKFHIDTGSNFTPTWTGVFVNSHNEKFVSYNDQAVGSLDKGAENSKANIAMTLNLAEADVLKKLDLLIADPLIRRAYYASRDDGLTQLGTDLKVAADYLEYLQNPMVINAMIAQDKTSKFSVGWAITLLRAKELGLDRVSALDFRGGFYVNLKDHEAVQGPRGAAAGFAPERMAWIPDFEASDLSAGHTNSGSLLLRSSDGLSTVTAENVFAPGKLTKIEGNNDTVTVDARKASSTERSLVFVKAGSGDKTIYGSEKWGSILVGGNGKQTLVGGAGNDWLRAGANNVSLIGGDGDDLLVADTGTLLMMDGGKGRNTYILGPDGADVKVSAIDPNGSDTIVAVTSGARSENNIIDITARSSDGHAVYSNKTAVAYGGTASSFDRSGTDLVITTVSGEVRSVNNTDENGNVISTELQYTADTAKGKIVVKNFFLTDSGIDQIKFSDGTSFTNKEIWNEAKVTVRIDDVLWNSGDATSTNTVIDTTNAQAGFLAQQTTTYNGNNIFIAFFSDDGTMWTNSFDPLARHDWQKWETAYRADGSISAEAVTFDVKDASGNFIKIGRATGGMVAGGVGDDVLRSASAGSTLIGDRGNDDLSGSGGADLLYGGSGDDRYTVGAGDQVFEFTGQGTDVVEATVSYALAAGQSIEELRLADLASTMALNLTGNEFANILVGNAGANSLNGGTGSDVLRGGGGNDIYIVDVTGDQVQEAAGGGVDEVRTALTSYTLGAEVENLRYTGSAAFTGTGNALDNALLGGGYNDALNGGVGDDTLNGLGGDDVLRGGTGNDLYFVDSAGDTVTEATGEGTDELQTTLASYTLGAEVENLRYIGNAAFSGTGNALDNILVGRAGDDSLDGGVGDDTLDGGTGTDTMRGGVGDDTYRVDSASDQVLEAAGAGNDTVLSDNSFTLAAGQAIEILQMSNATSLNNAGLAGNEFDNTLIGNAGANNLFGNAGNDTLDGGAGNDTMRGGGGNDIYVVDAIGDTITEVAGEGTDGIRTTLAGYTLGAEIENLRYYGSAAFTGTGNALDNALTGSTAGDTLSGGDGNDTLNGLGGNDVLRGGTGNDVYLVDSAGDTVTEAAGEGTDELQTNLASYTLGAEVENLRYIGSAAFSGTGNALDNILVGRAGNDSLNGGTGNDVLRGGAGDDTYRVENASDQVFELDGEGLDTILSDNSFTLAAGQEIEVLRLTFATSTTARGLSGNEFDNNLIGNAGDNNLRGNAGNDTLDGGDGGADVIDGGSGRDTVSYASSSRAVTVTLNDNLTWDGVTNDTLASIENATGSAFDDTLVGDANSNVLDGAAGADTMRGGLGNDTYAVHDASDRVFEAAGEGTDLIVSTVSYQIGTGQEIEQIQLARSTGTQALNLTGNELNNILWGNGGNNTLDGRAGADQMDGNAGNDTYGVDDVGDTVVEIANEGTDTVIAGNTHYTLAAGVSVEIMRFAIAVTGDFDLTGNELNNDITGTAGSNVLVGGGGSDILRGREGDDAYSVDHAGDQVLEGTGQGNDTVIALTSYKLQAGQEIETLQLASATAGASLNLEGNEFANALSGNSGANRLTGGDGSDTLWGKAGADTFVFNASLGTGNVDKILDFVGGEDKILLDNSVMTVLSAGTLAASAFKNISQAGTDADDRILYKQATGELFYDVDGSGSGTAVRFAVLDNKATLGYQDFLVA